MKTFINNEFVDDLYCLLSTYILIGDFC